MVNDRHEIFGIINSLIRFSIAIIYGFIFSNLPSYFFRDRNNYLTIYAEDFDFYLDRMSGDWKIIFSEPLYFLINKILFYFKDPVLTVQIIVFFNCFVITYFALRYSKSIFGGIILLLLLFLNSQFLALELIALRQGLALAILLLSISFVNTRVRLLFLLFLLGSIHISFYVIFIFFLFEYVLSEVLKVENDRKKLSLIVVFGIVINLFVLLISKYLRVNKGYEGFEADSSGALFLVWFVMLVYLLAFKSELYYAENKQDKLFYKMSVIGLIIYLTSYFLSPIAGRIIGTFIPFIYISLLRNKNDRDIIFLVAFNSLILYMFFVMKTFEGFLQVDLESFLNEISIL